MMFNPFQIEETKPYYAEHFLTDEDEQLQWKANAKRKSSVPPSPFITIFIRKIYCDGRIRKKERKKEWERET